MGDSNNLEYGQNMRLEHIGGWSKGEAGKNKKLEQIIGYDKLEGGANDATC